MTTKKPIPGAQAAAEKIANAQEPRDSHVALLLAGERKIIADYPGLLEKYVAPPVEKMAKLEEETTKLKMADALTKEQQLAADLAVREKQMALVGAEILKGMDQVTRILDNQKGSVGKVAHQLSASVYTKAGKTHSTLYAGGLQSVTDIPVKTILGPSPKLTDAFRKRNKETQKLITSLKPDGHKRLSKIVNDAVKGKKTNLRRQIAPLIKKESLRTWETIDNRAQLIAVDQMHTYTADLQEIRSQQAGITHYFWRKSGAAGVRPQDQEQDGNRYAYAKPPPGGGPGKKIRCRCTGEPDLASVAWLQEEQEEKKAPTKKKPKKKAPTKKKPPVSDEKAIEKIVGLPVADPDDATEEGDKKSPLPYSGRSFLYGDFKSSDLEKAPIKSIPMDKLMTQQLSVNEEMTIEKILGAGGSSDLPLAIRTPDGEDVLVDGNHRAVAAWAKGAKSLKVRLLNLDSINANDDGARIKRILKDGFVFLEEQEEKK